MFEVRTTSPVQKSKDTKRQTMNKHMFFSNEVRPIVPTSDSRVATVLFYYFKLKVYDVYNFGQLCLHLTAEWLQFFSIILSLRFTMYITCIYMQRSRLEHFL